MILNRVGDKVHNTSNVNLNVIGSVTLSRIRGNIHNTNLVAKNYCGSSNYDMNMTEIRIDTMLFEIVPVN